MTTRPKEHIPAEGRGFPGAGEALCGRDARWITGDHDLIRRLALTAVAEGDAGHYCAECIAKLSR